MRPNWSQSIAAFRSRSYSSSRNIISHTAGSYSKNKLAVKTFARGAVFDVDVEDPFEQPGPTQARRRVIACGRVAYSGGLGTISRRSFAFGASTPWKRIRCKRGRGTRAARRCMNSSGDMTIWVGAVFERALQLQHHLAGAVTLS